MTQYSFKTQGTCSQFVTFRLEDDRVYDVRFSGGCHGNLQAVARLVEGLPYQEVVNRIGGIRCGEKRTSCPDQLARALRLAAVRPPAG